MFNIKGLKQQLKSLRNQRGAFSPFMFGMLAGLAVFSGALRSQYLNELGTLESQRNTRLINEAKELESSVKNFLRSQTSSTFNSTITVANIQELLATDGATTDSGQAYQIKIIPYTISYINNATAAVTRDAQIFLMTSSDDSLLRTQVDNTTTRTDAFTLAKEPHVVVVDTESVRQEQVALSKKRLEGMASLLYDYYTRGFFSGTTRLHTFPRDATEYNAMVATYNLTNEAKDSWGQNLTYTVNASGNTTDLETSEAISESAVISFVTPWSERYPLTVSVQQ